MLKTKKGRYMCSSYTKVILFLLYCFVITLLYYFFGMTYPYAPLLCFASGTAAFGFGWQKHRNRNKLCGALIGGMIGAVLSFSVQFALTYLMFDNFEDEGLGYARSVLLFAPLISLLGLLAGFFIWGAAGWLDYLRRCNRDGHMRKINISLSIFLVVVFILVVLLCYL